MTQYDPMGLISPLLVTLKIKLRKLYEPEMNLGWDDHLPEDLHQSWIDTLATLLRMGEIVLDRCIKPEGVEGPPELVGF